MKLNKRIKEIFDKMFLLEIPKQKRREYIERAYVCGFKFGLSYNYQVLNAELDECIKETKYSKDAIKKIDSAFAHLNRYSEENYQHPWIERLGRKLP